MKQMLIILSLCMTIIASCIKEQSAPKSMSSQIESRVTYMDDFYLSKNVRPVFHRIDTATTITVFSDSVYNNFGGSLRHISFKFSNPNIDYRNLKLTVASTTGEQRVSYSAASATVQNDVKVLTFDSPNGILISPGWSTIVLKAKIFGNQGANFYVTIPKGGITYYSINNQPGAAVGLPLSSEGLKIR